MVRVILKETGVLLSQMYVPYKKNLPQNIHQRFLNVSISRLKQMQIKGLMDPLPPNIPDLE